jgi:hypothetical protein
VIAACKKEVRQATIFLQGSINEERKAMRKLTLECRIAFWAVLFGLGLAATSPALAESKFSFA